MQAAYPDLTLNDSASVTSAELRLRCVLLSGCKRLDTVSPNKRMKWGQKVLVLWQCERAGTFVEHRAWREVVARRRRRIAALQHTIMVR